MMGKDGNAVFRLIVISLCVLFLAPLAAKAQFYRVLVKETMKDGKKGEPCGLVIRNTDDQILMQCFDSELTPLSELYSFDKDKTTWDERPLACHLNATDGSLASFILMVPEYDIFLQGVGGKDEKHLCVSMAVSEVVETGSEKEYDYTTFVKTILPAMLKSGRPASGAQGREDADKVLEQADQMPEFPGGNSALYQFLFDNLRYPAAAQENGIQGRVVVSFVVRQDGTLHDVTVARGIDPVLDAEAVRVVESMPNFIPGKNGGRPVNVKVSLPITFRI